MPEQARYFGGTLRARETSRSTFLHAEGISCRALFESGDCTVWRERGPPPSDWNVVLPDVRPTGFDSPCGSQRRMP
jgi:hypothetical protein